jgi:hypothetical protein
VRFVVAKRSEEKLLIFFPSAQMYKGARAAAAKACAHEKSKLESLNKAGVSQYVKREVHTLSHNLYIKSAHLFEFANNNTSGFFRFQELQNLAALFVCAFSRSRLLFNLLIL